MTESPQPSPPPQWVWSFRTATCCPPHPTLLQWLQILDGWAGGGGLQEHFLPLPWLPHLSASPPFQLGLLFHPNHLFSCQEERSLQRFKRREDGTPLGKFPGCPGHPHCSPGFTPNSQPRGAMQNQRGAAPGNQDQPWNSGPRHTTWSLETTQLSGLRPCLDEKE